MVIFLIKSNLEIFGSTTSKFFFFLFDFGFVLSVYFSLIRIGIVRRSNAPSTNLIESSVIIVWLNGVSYKLVRKGTLSTIEIKGLSFESFSTN